ncbi:MAG: 50S ribosomal protein L10 [Actinobacteria bacterium]|nr:50S ribosomal protein L10 [Actinomycetota bacterium]
MAKSEKASAVSELAEDFRTSQATLVTEYRGLSVTSIKALRRTLGSTTKYSVVKNTLTKIAAREAGVPIPDEMLKGPSALAFVKGDPIDAARMLRDFSRENPFLVIKGGIYEGKAVTSEEVMQLANLESREVLLAKLAGAMKGSIAKAARVFDALRIMRIKLESGAPTEVAASVEVAAPVEVVAVVTEEAAAPVIEVVEEVAVSPEPVIENNKEEE